MNRSRGFTLIEVIISLSILSMIMVATISSLRTFAQTKEVIERATSRVDEVRLVSAFLTESIQGAMPIMRTGASPGGVNFEGNYGPFFWGSPRELIWVAPVTAGAGYGGTFIHRLARVGDRLELWWRPYDSNAAKMDWSKVKSHVLVEQLDEFTLAYRPAYQMDWLGRWDSALNIPVSVRLNLKSRDKYWPELVVRLDQGQLVLR